MRDQFITSKNIGHFDSLVNIISPPVSSSKNRIAFVSARRHVCHVAITDGPVNLDLLEGYNIVYSINRAPKLIEIKVPCGLAADQNGFEYDIVCQIGLNITIRDTANAIERAIRDFEAEYKMFVGLTESRMRSLVRFFVHQQGKIHAQLDVVKCCVGLEQAALNANSVFQVVQVHQASFGDPSWKDHRARHFQQQEVEANATTQQTIRTIRREEETMGAAQRVMDLQREYTAKAEDFRRLLDRADAEHKIAKVRLALDQRDPEAALAILDPGAYGLITAHRERMSEIEKRALAKFNDDLVSILKRRLF